MPPLLVLQPMAADHLAQLSQHFDVVHAPTPALRADAIDRDGARFRAVLTIGSIGLTADEIARLPNITFICALGVGFENIDVAAARARGIVVANGAGANADSVADHAFGLIIATVRRIPEFDAAARAGTPRDALRMPPGLTGRTLGILGMGAIGRALARRAEGFGLPVGYHNRRPADTPHRYFDSPRALAAWSDILVVATPGGPDTVHLVDAEVLAALGPDGYLVNVARGSVVDTAALARALRAGQLAGAGLDVYEGEPAAPGLLLDLPGVVLTPHVAGWSPASVQATIDLFLQNADRHFQGLPVLTPV